MGLPRRHQPARRPTTRIVPAAGRRHLPPEQPLNVRFQLQLIKNGFPSHAIGFNQTQHNETNCVILVKQLEKVIGNVSLHEDRPSGGKQYIGVQDAAYFEYLSNPIDNIGRNRGEAGHNRGSVYPIRKLKETIDSMRTALANTTHEIRSIDVGGGFKAVCGMDSAGIMQVRIVAERSENATIATLTGSFHAEQARQAVQPPAAAPARPAPAAAGEWWAGMAPAAPA
ncbi:hypothetical protein EBZ35_02330, partial [bacterium]|nr:hypothetical protein [bacterium]